MANIDEEFRERMRLARVIQVLLQTIGPAKVVIPSTAILVILSAQAAKESRAGFLSVMGDMWDSLEAHSR